MSAHNQVQIVGVAVERTPWLVVLEMMQYGDLKQVRHPSFNNLNRCIGSF